MKIRNCFVANSSTSSFICNVCHEVFAERDLCLSDIDMIRCVKGHYVCCEHMSSELKQKYDDYEDTEEYAYEGRYEVPSECCPICMLEEISDKDVKSYIEKKYDITYEGIRKEISGLFGFGSEASDKFNKYLEAK